jgi:hypothetical protein
MTSTRNMLRIEPSKREQKYLRCLTRLAIDDGRSAIVNPKHACHPFIIWQQREGCLVDTRQVQLPEPFSGRRSILRLGLVGMNPGYDPDERFPIVSWLSHCDAPLFREPLRSSWTSGCPWCPALGSDRKLFPRKHTLLLSPRCTRPHVRGEPLQVRRQV